MRAENTLEGCEVNGKMNADESVKMIYNAVDKVQSEILLPEITTDIYNNPVIN